MPTNEKEELEIGGFPFLNRKAGAAELFLIRHGDALPGPETAIPGSQYDDQPLSDYGRLQAEALAESLKSTPFDAIFSSPLRRTRETAAPLARLLGIEVQVDEGLLEVRLGTEIPQLKIPTGTTPAETAQALRARMEYIVGMAARTGFWSSIPGAEPSENFRARVVAGVDGLAARYPGKRIALFSHGGAINVYLAEVLGISKDFFFPIPNTSVNIARVAGKRRLLLAINDICHLRSAGLSPDV